MVSHTCTPCGGNGEPKCTTGDKCKPGLGLIYGSGGAEGNTCGCGGQGQPACASTGCTGGDGENDACGLCWNSNPDTCGVPGKAACSYSWYAGACSSTNKLCDSANYPGICNDGGTCVANNTPCSGGKTCVDGVCIGCGANQCYAPGNSPACVANGQKASAGTYAGQTCCGTTFKTIDSITSCGTCSSTINCQDRPENYCSSEQACVAGQCRYTCWSGFNGILPASAASCGNPNECQKLPPVGVSGQPNCFLQPKAAGAMCNVGAFAPLVADGTKFGPTGLPYGKPSWSESWNGPAVTPMVCGTVNSLPACVSGNPDNFANGRRQCGGNSQLPCTSAGQYVNGTEPVRTVPENACIPDSNQLVVPRTDGNLSTDRKGWDRDNGGWVQCNNTFTSGGQGYGDVVRVLGDLKLEDKTGVCCYNGAGGTASDAWKVQEYRVEGDYVGGRFICDDLISSCKPPGCSCPGGLPDTACGVPITFTPSAGSPGGNPQRCYGVTLYCGLGTLNCPAPITCGNNVLDSGEECDRGGNNGDVCSAPYGGTCTYCSSACKNVVVTGPYCGDSIIQGTNGENCDAGASNGAVCTPAYGGSCTYCSNACQPVTVVGPYCGDGIKNGAEACDAGASNGACPASCSATCTVNPCPETCTNGVDDNADGHVDYFGPSAATPKGDTLCKVNLVSVTASPSPVATQQFTLSCKTGITSAPAHPGIYPSGCDAVSFKGWSSSSTADFYCTINTPGVRTLRCTVDTVAYSYSDVPTLTADFTVVCPAGTVQSGTTCIESYCADGVDNDAGFNTSGHLDYDGVSGTNHGDIQCKVGVSNLQVPASVVVGNGFAVTCDTTNKTRSTGVNVSGPGLAATNCNFRTNSWTGSGPFTGIYDCPALPSVGSYSVMCFVDPAKSFQTGANTTKTVAATCPSNWVPVGGVCVNCDVDNDLFNNKSIAACNNGIKPPTDCHDNNAAVKPGAVELCTDGLDNNCNGEADYDGFTGGLISPAMHGDIACKVKVMGTGVDDPWCVGGTFPANCTFNVGNIRSSRAELIMPGLTVECPDVKPNAWTGATAAHNCPAGVTGDGTLRCSVDTSKSYQDGGNMSAAVRVNGANQACGTNGVCGASGACIPCDADKDLYNNRTLLGCSAPATDCNDNPAAIPGTNPVLTGADVNPGKPKICGNTVDEDCSGCVSKCNVTWNGYLKDLDGFGVSGTVQTDDGERGSSDSVTGEFTLNNVDIGNRTFSGNTSNYDYARQARDLNGCVNPVLLNLTLRPAECRDDCTYQGLCTYNTCLGKNACSIGNIRPEDRDFVKKECEWKEPGTVIQINSTHSIACCTGRVLSTASVKNPVSIQGCSENLITLSRTVNYQGRIMTLEIITYNKCE